ncbi:MAG: hypothetical protein HOC20_00340 [Chloroflexi bacterium]|nr:hypothetical protein [Chloroflexota bacterium]
MPPPVIPPQKLELAQRMAAQFQELEVDTPRNYVVHQDKDIKDADMAKTELQIWITGLNTIVKIQ